MYGAWQTQQKLFTMLTQNILKIAINKVDRPFLRLTTFHEITPTFINLVQKKPTISAMKLQNKKQMT